MDTGDREKENALRNQIENLEEQAAELYKKRTNNISSIGCVLVIVVVMMLIIVAFMV